MSNADKKLIRAAKEGALGGVKAALAAGADLHTDDDMALAMAAASGHLHVVQFLLEAGANLHSMDDYPLQTAAINGHPDVVRCLLKAGADVHAEDDCSLQVAAQYKHPTVIRVLREHGARLSGLTSPLGNYTEPVQVALLGAGDVSGLLVSDLAEQGVSPAALCALLERQGRGDLSAMLSTTQMLEPLTPDARAAVLSGLIPKKTRREATHVGPR